MHHEVAVPRPARMGVDNENIPGLTDADGTQTLLEFAKALGQIDPDKQDAKRLPVLDYRLIAGVVLAPEKTRDAMKTPTCLELRVGGVTTVQQGAHRPATILLLERRGHSDEIVAITHKKCRDRFRFGQEAVKISRLVIDQNRAVIKGRRAPFADTDALVLVAPEGAWIAELHRAKQTVAGDLEFLGEGLDHAQHLCIDRSAELVGHRATVPLGNPKNEQPSRKESQNQSNDQGQNKFLADAQFPENHIHPRAC